jgi:hypothetical protein
MCKYVDKVFPKESAKSERNIDRKVVEDALRQAEEIRKYEISLYWKRANYYVILLGAVVVGIVNVLGRYGKLNNVVLLLLAVAGAFIAWGWCFATMGSKFWQCNWEAHVDFLEKEMGTKLHGVILHKNKIGFLADGPYSVSKINQSISLITAMAMSLFLFVVIIRLFFCDICIQKNFLTLIDNVWVARIAGIILTIAVLVLYKCVFIKCIKSDFADAIKDENKSPNWISTAIENGYQAIEVNSKESNK